MQVHTWWQRFLLLPGASEGTLTPLDMALRGRQRSVQAGRATVQARRGTEGITLCCCQLLPVTNVPVLCPVQDFVLSPGLPAEGAGAAGMVGR